MFISASSEFVALCQSQVTWLRDGLGAARSAVYLAKEAEGGTRELVPVVVYPETGSPWQERSITLASETWNQAQNAPRLLSAALPEPESSQAEPIDANQSQAQGDDNRLQQQHQLVLPLLHEGIVLGLLIVTGREDRAWSDRELAQIERIAKTLALACVLDQRQGWYKQQLGKQQQFQQQQRDRLDDFLHQLRNPLTALRTFSKLLLKRFQVQDVRDEQAWERSRAIAENIVRESDRLQELLQQFDESVDLMAQDHETLALETTPAALSESATQPSATYLLPGQNLSEEAFAVTEILEPLLSSAEAIAVEKDIAVTTEIPAQLTPVRANRRALREVLSNLLDNALKYTPQGGQVQIQAGLKRITPTEKWQQGIAISDNGPGIPPEDQARIFERHYRGVQASGAIPGTGLGLAIAKELTEQMHGEIELISPASVAEENQPSSLPGTEFIVWLPIVGT